MNVARAFASYLQDTGVATLGQDLFISRAPLSTEVPSRIFWLKASGGTEVAKSVNGRAQRQHLIEVYHRDTDTAAVYDVMQELSDDLTCAGCLTLEGYEVLEVSTSGPFTDQDLDDEERTVGLLQVRITIRKEC